VDATSFEIRVQKWNYLDGTYTTENVSYIVMERGSYILDDGTKVGPGRFDTDTKGSFGWVDFIAIPLTKCLWLQAVSQALMRKMQYAPGS